MILLVITKKLRSVTSVLFVILFFIKFRSSRLSFLFQHSTWRTSKLSSSSFSSFVFFHFHVMSHFFTGLCSPRQLAFIPINLASQHSQFQLFQPMSLFSATGSHRKQITRSSPTFFSHVAVVDAILMIFLLPNSILYERKYGFRFYTIFPVITHSSKFILLLCLHHNNRNYHSKISDTVFSFSIDMF